MSTSTDADDLHPAVSRRSFLKRGAALGVASAAAPILAACGASASGGGSGGTSGGGATLKVGETELMDTLNPFVAETNLPWSILPAIYPTLTQQASPGGPPAGNWATSWKRSPDGLRYELKLRSGGRWTDGRPLTARDAAFTLNMLVKHQSGAAAAVASYVTGIKRATAPDPTTLVIDMSSPFPGMLSMATTLEIFPEHDWTQAFTGDAHAITTKPIDSGAVTCGPFRLQTFAPTGVTLLKAYPHTFGPRPHFDVVGFNYLASDASLLEAFETGSIDMNAWQANTLVGINKVHDVSVEYGPAGRIWYIGFNMSPHLAVHRELQDLRVRTALAHATNRQAIVDRVLGGHGKPGAQWLPPSAGHWQDPTIAPEPFDPRLANEMLDALGFTRGSGGVRMAHGQPMSYTFACSTGIGPTVQRVAQLVVADWAQVGVQLSPRFLDTAALVQVTSSKQGMQTGTVHMWYNTMLPDPNFAVSELLTSQVGDLNDENWSNAQYDRLYQAQLEELDLNKRESLIHEMQRIFFAEKPAIVLTYPTPFTVTRHGFAPPNLASGTGAFPAWNNGWTGSVRPA